MEVQRRLMDALFGADDLGSIDNVVSFVSAMDKMREPSRLLLTGPAEFAQYCNRHLGQLMHNNSALPVRNRL